MGMLTPACECNPTRKDGVWAARGRGGFRLSRTISVRNSADGPVCGECGVPWREAEARPVRSRPVCDVCRDWTPEVMAGYFDRVAARGGDGAVMSASCATCGWTFYPTVPIDSPPNLTTCGILHLTRSCR